MNIEEVTKAQPKWHVHEHTRPNLLVLGQKCQFSKYPYNLYWNLVTSFFEIIVVPAGASLHKNSSSRDCGLKHTICRFSFQAWLSLRYILHYCLTLNLEKCWRFPITQFFSLKNNCPSVLWVKWKVAPINWLSDLRVQNTLLNNTTTNTVTYRNNISYQA